MGCHEYQGFRTVYVKSFAGGENNGTSWDDAFEDFQSALDEAISQDQIWVAAGIYFPSSNGNRNASFELIHDDVPVFGGFFGEEMFLFDRDVAENPTILSGNLGVSDETFDDSYRVVVADEPGFTFILNGFIIERGNAEDECQYRHSATR